MLKLLLLCFAAHASTEAGAAPNSGRRSPLAHLPLLCSRPGRSRLRCASRFQASPSACAPGAHAIRPQVYAARGWSRTCLRSPPRLTLRSWGLPPARHLAREALTVIIRLAGQAPSRRQPLSSNVRQQVAALGCSPSPLGGSRRRIPNALLPRRSGSSRQQRARLSGLRGKALAAMAQPQGASRVAMSSLGLALAASPALALRSASATGAHGRCPQFQVVGQLRKRGRVCKQRQVQRRWWSLPASELQRSLLKSSLARQPPWLPPKAAA